MGYRNKITTFKTVELCMLSVVRTLADELVNTFLKSATASSSSITLSYTRIAAPGGQKEHYTAHSGQSQSDGTCFYDASYFYCNTIQRPILHFFSSPTTTTTLRSYLYIS